MKTSIAKSASRTAIVLVALGLTATLGYVVGGINWAAAAFTAVGMAWWLWSARRSNRQRGPETGPRLIVDRAGQFASEERPGLSLRRIRVANTGGRPMDQVEVKLVRCRPAPSWFQPLRLQRMQGGAHPFSLAPDSQVYVEFVALPQGHSDFIIVPDSAAHAGLPNGIAVQPLELTVQVTAYGLPGLSLVFELSRSALGELELIERAR